MIISVRIFLLILFTFGILNAQDKSHSASKTYHSEDYINEAKNWSYIRSDSNIQLLETAKEKNIIDKDTLALIRTQRKLSVAYAHIAQYDKAYDGYWEALLLAEQINNKAEEAYIYNGLGWLYSLYDRKKDAIHYFNKSARINQELAEQNKHRLSSLLSNYYALTTLHRKQKDVQMARLYLDSCRYINSTLDRKKTKSSYFDAELGRILYLEQKYDEALNVLLPFVDTVKESDPSFMVILGPFLGDIYKEKGVYNKSEHYYTKALELAYQTQSHLDLVPEIYESLASLYEQRQQFDGAFRMLKIAQILNEQQFGSKSERNHKLLAIKDNYRLEKQKQQSVIQKQRLTQLEQDNRISNLKTYLLGSSLLLFFLVVLFLYRYLRIKHKAEKKIISQQKEIELQKTKEVVEMKNKELTASALQAIEKEEVLSEIKEKLTDLKKDPTPLAINKLIKGIGSTNNSSWEEFEIRFLAVNESFYEKLKVQFPALSQNDHRLCALIRLHFSSKDMARLLGISVESVHTSRYRLRKKLNLERNINLEDFIANI